MNLPRFRDPFVEDIFFIFLMLFGVIFALVMAGCGRPTLTEILAGRKVKCAVEIVVPEGKRAGDKINVDAELSQCREVE